MLWATPFSPNLPGAAWISCAWSSASSWSGLLSALWFLFFFFLFRRNNIVKIHQSIGGPDIVWGQLNFLRLPQAVFSRALAVRAPGLLVSLKGLQREEEVWSDGARIMRLPSKGGGGRGAGVQTRKYGRESVMSLVKKPGRDFECVKVSNKVTGGANWSHSWNGVLVGWRSWVERGRLKSIPLALKTTKLAVEVRRYTSNASVSIGFLFIFWLVRLCQQLLPAPKSRQTEWPLYPRRDMETLTPGSRNIQKHLPCGEGF